MAAAAKFTLDEQQQIAALAQQHGPTDGAARATELLARPVSKQLAYKYLREHGKPLQTRLKEAMSSPPPAGQEPQRPRPRGDLDIAIEHCRLIQEVMARHTHDLPLFLKLSAELRTASKERDRIRERDKPRPTVSGFGFGPLWP